MFVRTPWLVLVVALWAAFAVTTRADNVLTIGTAYADPGEINIGYRLMLAGDDNLNATCQARYRRIGEPTWHNALAPVRFSTYVTPSEDSTGGTNNVIDRAENRFAGSIFWVEPGQGYEIELTLADPDGVSGINPVILNTVTWTELVPNPAGRKLYVIPGSGGGTGTITDPFKGLPAAHAAALPGDIFYIGPGTYPAFTITKNGTAGNPICWIGPADQSAILDGGGTAIALQLGDASNPIRYQIVERMTFRNTPSALYASRVQYTKVRHCRLETTGSGYYNSGQGTEFRHSVMDCTVLGDEPWIVSNIGASQGIEIKGTAGIVAHNLVKGFADGISIDPYTSTKTSPYGSNNNCYDCYGNFVSECGDDGIEMDHIVANARAWRNAVTSCRMGFSNQPLFGGPCYIFRNESFCLQDATNGTATGSAYKLHNGASGTVLIHNTSSKNAQGMTSCMFQNSYFRNNVLMGATDTLNMYTCGTYNTLPPSPSVNDWDYDAYRAGSGRTLVDWFNQQSYTSLALLASQRGVEGHGKIATYSHFAQAVPPTTYTAPGKTVSDFDFTLVAGAPEINAGAILPNINDPFVTDGQPDIGALEYGQPRPKYGPRPVGDVNCDFVVDANDLIALRNTLGVASSLVPRSDVFIDGLIDVKDVVFSRNRTAAPTVTWNGTSAGQLHLGLLAPDGSNTVRVLPGQTFTANLVADVQNQPLVALAYLLSADLPLQMTGRSYNASLSYIPSTATEDDLPLSLGTWQETAVSPILPSGDGLLPASQITLATFTFLAPSAVSTRLSLSQPDAAFTSLRYPEGRTFDQVSTGGALTIILRLPGDINNDDSVDVLDLLYLVDTFGLAAGEPGYLAQADFDNTGEVDVVDLLILAENFGRTR
jgi:hypothetical protein